MTSAEGPPSNLFRIEGEYWTIAFDGRVCRLRDTRGLRYLAHLLANPATRVPAVELLVAGRGPGSPGSDESGGVIERQEDSRRERARVTVSKGITAALRRIDSAHPALGQHLEVTIKRGYLCSYNPDPRISMRWEM